MGNVDKDVLVQVVEDEECNALLVEALRTELKKGPVAFYTNFVAPRSGKMKEPVAGIVNMTVVQEVADMHQATAPKEDNAKNEPSN